MKCLFCSFARPLLIAAGVLIFSLAQRPNAPADSHDLPVAGAPRADHHTHIWSETAAALLAGQPVPAGKRPEAVTAERVILELDAAGIRRATVLSVAYWFESWVRKPPIEGAYAKVQAENDWVAEQAARYPGRLVAFFSFNPLNDHALEEIDRCAKDPRFKGIKLHFANSGVDVLNARHIESLQRVFRAANGHRLPIVVHLWILGRYGAEHSEAFLQKIIPAAPDIPIQIAHLAASGPGYHSDTALEVFAKAAASGDPRMKNIYFDVAGIVLGGTPPKTLELVAKRLRQLGMRRILFGSDRAGAINVPPAQAWAAFRRLPLTDEEFRNVAENLAPYLR
jgi:predicted TIM-barrel fold metal-dependent hydrolase